MLDLQAYLNRLASAQPTPGGGSAATIVGALGAALVAMVARITLGSEKHAAVHADAVLLVATADTLRARFVGERPLDEAAYAAVMEARALPRATQGENAARTTALQAAFIGAAAAPLRVAALAATLLEACASAAALRNTHLMSDAGCALAFGRAALDATTATVRVNHRFIQDAAIVDAQTHELAAIHAAAQTAVDRAQVLFAEG